MGKIELLYFGKRGGKVRIPIAKTDMTQNPLMGIEEIGNKLGVNWNQISEKEFRMGLDEEKEHDDVTGGDPIVTGKIVLAHLKEDSQYYTKLKAAMGAK